MAVRFFHPGIIILGLALTAALMITAFLLRKKNRRRITVRAANTERFRATEAYRKKRLESMAYRAVLTAGLVLALVSALILAARPYQKKAVKEDVTKTDIFLCMDISSSGVQGLSGFVEEFGKLVRELDGDQIGISLFNTSSIQYVPVTEDYDFVIQRLEELAAYFRAADEFKTEYADRYAFAHEIPQDKRARFDELNAVLSAFDRGTTAGYEKKGTSVIGEGLASCLFSFPELMTEARPRIILFVTDNIPEPLDDPLVTLEDAAKMCAYDGVIVHGIYPAAGQEDRTDQAKAEMKAAAEAAGGMFFDLANDNEAERILDEVRNTGHKHSKTVTYSRDEDTPEIWTALLFAGLALALAALVFLVVKTRGQLFKSWKTGQKAAALAVLLAAAACAALIAVRPVREDVNAEIRTTNLDVCFAVDTTISMWAEDYHGEEKRMDGVKEDIARIMDGLPGSSFSMLRFDNGVQVLAPYVRSVAVVEGCAEHISIPAYSTATGSSINTVHDALASMIRASKQKSGDRKTVVFLMSDGEITDGSELMSFHDLEAGIDDGAVLGYGTDEGGRMNYPGQGYLRDTARGEDARSVIDEGNLTAVARDLGLMYVHRRGEDAGDLNRVLERIRRLSMVTALQNGERTGWAETYHYFAAILALILMGCLFRLLRRGSLL